MTLIDLDRFPLGRPGPAYDGLVRGCQDELARDGLFNLHGLVTPQTLSQSIAQIGPALVRDGYNHRAEHNIYFKPHIEGLAADHPALRRAVTSNRKLCADQLLGNPILDIYAFPPLIRFIADVMGLADLHTMADPLAAVNVMAYGDGEALNWHFDRSEFTVTLLLQAPDEGGVFEHRQALRHDEDPNYDGVARLLAGADPDVRQLNLTPGSLNVFRGKNTAHRVTPVQGSRQRIIAVFSYYARPGVRFSDQEQRQFYGRTA